jgi:hypothetical protein
MQLTLILVAIIAVLVAIFIFRYRIIAVMGVALNLLFVLMIVMGLSALFVPQVYAGLADQTLQQTGTLTTIRDFDKNISTVTTAPQDIWQGILNLFGGSTNNTATPTETAVKSGPLENSLYPNLVNTITLIFRALALIISIAGMLVVIYLSYSTLGASKLTKLQSEYEELRKRMVQLETSNTTTV